MIKKVDGHYEVTRRRSLLTGNNEGSFAVNVATTPGRLTYSTAFHDKPTFALPFHLKRCPLRARRKTFCCSFKHEQILMVLKVYTSFRALLKGIWDYRNDWEKKSPCCSTCPMYLLSKFVNAGWSRHQWKKMIPGTILGEIVFSIHYDCGRVSDLIDTRLVSSMNHLYTKA